MTGLLAAKVSPETVDSLSAYRTVYDALAGVEAADVDTTARVIAGICGAVCVLCFGFLAFGALPRPRFGASAREISDQELGVVEVGPRALERLAEVGAGRVPDISGARARYADERLELGVEVDRAEAAGRALGTTASRARAELREHGLPEPPIDVTLEGFSPTPRRNLR
ncbi:MAG: hypothetical protein ACRDL3_01030 [Solirubrobacterales bacterium]